ncbi:MAG: hypothetical protein JNJ60_06235 [Rhodocyclaceae bacterium]|nr:hypothetical protein [Rhodocyclaceae bacterium]
MRQTFCILLALVALTQAALAGPPAQLQALADRAVANFRDSIELPVAQLPYLCILGREDGRPLRDYAVGAYTDAIAALLERAGTPENERRAARILRSIVHGGSAVEMDQWLAEAAAGDARAARDAAAQVELPAALAARLGGNCGPNFAGRLGRDFQPAGRLAESDYRRAAALDPGDAWTWLVLAWLAEDRGLPDLELSLAAARASRDAAGQRAALFATLQRARLWERQNRLTEAEADLKAAVQLAAQSAAAARDMPPEAQTQALRDLGHAQHQLAALQYRHGEFAAAAGSLQQALDLRSRLAQAAPLQVALQIDLIATLQLFDLVDSATPQARPGTPAGEHGARAIALYKALAGQVRYQPMMGKSAWAGMAATAMTIAAVATLGLGLLLLALFRRRVAYWMMVAAPAAATARPAPADAMRTAARLDIRVIESSGHSPQRIASALMRGAGSAHRRATWVHLGAGLGFGLLAAILWLWSSATEPTFTRIAIAGWSWAWPTVLVLGLIWAGDRPRQLVVVAGYFAVLLLLCLGVALGGTPPMPMFGVRVAPFFLGLVEWLLTALPSAVLLLFLNRRVRSIGPPLMAIMLTLACGATLAGVAASTPAGLAAAGMLLFRLGIPEPYWIALIPLAGAALAAPLAWWVAARLGALHAAKWVNDQSMVIDTIWLFQALMLCQEMAMERGAVALAGLCVFVAAKLVVLLGMRPAVRAARERASARLLLLRTFRRQRSSERLFDLLGTRWRYAGPITLIAAPDLASSTLDPDEFLDFLAGRLGQRFIIDPDALPRRLQAVDASVDADGRYRVTELYCGSDSWQHAVRALMAQSDMVAMDLRGFNRNNQGCLFEVGTLLDLVPAGRIAFLIDATTDEAFLRQALASHMQQVHAHSPNASHHPDNALTMLNAGAGVAFAVDQLLVMGDALAAASSR